MHYRGSRSVWIMMSTLALSETLELYGYDIANSDAIMENHEVRGLR